MTADDGEQSPGHSRNRARVPLFVVSFMAMLLLLNYYNFYHFRFQFGPVPDLVFWPVYLFMALSMLLAYVLGYLSVGPLTRAFYRFAMAWLGFSIILILFLGIHDLLFRLVYFDTTVTVKALMGVVALMTVAGMVNARFLRTREIRLSAPALPRDVRIVQISDLHLGLDQGRRWLEKVVGRVNSLEPDLVLITGDLVDGPWDTPPEVFAPLGDLEAPAYLSTGNHEFIAGPEAVMPLLEDTGVRVLRNEGLELGNNIQLIAVDDTWEDRTVILETLDRVAPPDPERYTILMSHQPADFHRAARRGVDLMLSGHTHGGQFFPFVLMVGLAYRHGKGLYRKDGSVLYTTSGTGTWGPPLRLGSSNEVVVIDLGGG